MLEGEDMDGSPFISMLGIQNALRTGDVFTDMVIAMCVPFILRILFNWMGQLGELFDLEALFRRFERKTAVHERFISYTTEKSAWGDRCNADEDTQNSVLLKAIKMYLHQVVRMDLKSAYLDLTFVGDKNQGSCDDDDSDWTDDDFWEFEENGTQKTQAGQLSRYKIVNRLPYNEWHVIGNFGYSNGTVELRIEHTQQTKDGDEKNGNIIQAMATKNVENITYHFLSSEKDAIDAFVATAYKWYLGELKKMEDYARYYYEMKLPDLRLGKNNDSGSSESITYKRYKLSEEKSFDSLFFREKENLLALIDHFTAKTGKYSIKGYPHKLGVLLHGPPGTGKTSLIKALAQYTGRSIINVPLSRVTTNSELMSVFFDGKYRVEDSYVPVKLDFKDVIYVMEDCDAASNVVKRRSGQQTSDVGTLESINLPRPKSLWQLFLESPSAQCQEVVEELSKKSARLKEEAEKLRPKFLYSIAKRLNEQPALGLIDESLEDHVIAQALMDAMDSTNAMKEQQSKLDDILTSHAGAIKSLLDSDTEVCDDFIDELLGEKQSLRCHVSPGKARASTPNSASTGVPSSIESPAASNMFDIWGESNAKEKSSGFGPSFFKPNSDALSLSGLLNVLDGVVDTPGRIVILTSNHPELLDPALIRPGRVDKTLMLGYMSAADIVQMLELYYQTSLSCCQVGRVAAAVDGPTGDAKFKLKLTPAQIEQMAAEHDQLDDMIRVLEEKSPAIPSKTKIVENDPLGVCNRA